MVLGIRMNNHFRWLSGRAPNQSAAARAVLSCQSITGTGLFPVLTFARPFDCKYRADLDEKNVN